MTTRLCDALAPIPPGFLKAVMSYVMTYVMTYVMVAVQMTSPSQAFNVDLATARVHEGSAGSLFGFAVAQHVDQKTQWVVVGAPRANARGQSGVEKGGTVFRCQTDGDNCDEIPFDPTGNGKKWNTKNKDYRDYQNKSDQWFGATVAASGQTGVVVACAPRYVYFSKSMAKRNPVGACYLSQPSSQTYTKYSPCADGQSKYNEQGSCQAGFSATLSQDGKRLMIAAPGSWDWQGQLFNFKVNSTAILKETTHIRDPLLYDRLMGYASAIGYFDDDDKEDYVVSSPKGDLYLGRIEMYTQDMKLIDIIKGEQIGAYFGAALAVEDLNGDGLDDIIVGAPLFAKYDVTDNFDNGRVYIFYQTKSRTFKPGKKDILDGHQSRSRFGMALSGLGDLNLNGYNDLCIGAPFAGENRRGAIYIYPGSTMGIITEPSQIIYAEDIPSPLSAFGYSISGGMDQDNNDYPDMVVGAYQSDKAVVFRTRPVVKFGSTLKYNPKTNQVGGIDLDVKSCDLDGKEVSCMGIDTCVWYKGRGTPKELDFELTWRVDVKEKNASNKEQRVFFLQHPTNSSTTQTLTVAKVGEALCIHSYAYIKSDITDKLTPIRVTMEYKLLDQEGNKNFLRPILDANTPSTASLTVNILKDCPPDNICIPDLKLTFFGHDTKHVIGMVDPINIVVRIANLRDDSYNTKVWIEMAPGVDYGGIGDIRGSQSTDYLSCGVLVENDSMLSCDLGNPMPGGSESEFTVIFKPTNSNDTQDVFKFIVYANSTNPENGTYDNNEQVILFPVTVEPKIDLFGKADPALIILNTTDHSTKEKGRLVQHVFELENDGSCALNSTELQIRWPSHDEDGEPLLTLEGKLKLDGNGQCQTFYISPENANKMGYQDSLNVAGSGRTKRDANVEEIACGSHCTIIQCKVNYMARYGRFSLTVKARIKVREFLKGRPDTKIYRLVATANARVKSVPYDLKKIDKETFPEKTIDVATSINTYHLRPTSEKVDDWIIIVAVVCGILLLLIIILLLWLCGFFQRKKFPEDGYMVVNDKNDIDDKIVE